MTSDLHHLPPRFAAALGSLRSPRLRPGVRLVEIPGPSRIAPYTVALEGAATNPYSDSDEPDDATGRFVVLFDPDEQPGWQGDFRVVTMVRTTLDAEVAADPMLDEVGWSWVTGAFNRAGLDAVALGGTVTRVLSTKFGALTGDNASWGDALGPESVDVEVRASWTPATTDLGAHLQLWMDVLGTSAGMDSLPEGVTALASRRVALR